MDRRRGNSGMTNLTKFAIIDSIECSAWMGFPWSISPVARSSWINWHRSSDSWRMGIWRSRMR